MILHFFSPKILMTSKLRQNAADVFLINRQNNSNKIISTILTFYPEKNANKMVHFKCTEYVLCINVNAILSYLK